MLRRSAVTLFFLFSIFYIALNIYISQSVHPLYFKQVANENEYAVQYLSLIKKLPQFATHYSWYNSISNEDLHDRVYKDTIIRGEQIAHLEQILAKNPDSRDVLYTLSKLYSQQGNDIQAQMYLSKAKQIDPGLQ